MAKNYNFDEEFETDNIIDRVSNDEESDYFVEKEDGVYCSDGSFICDLDDEERQDKIDEHKEEWNETHWDKSVEVTRDIAMQYIKEFNDSYYAGKLKRLTRKVSKKILSYSKCGLDTIYVTIKDELLRDRVKEKFINNGFDVVSKKGDEEIKISWKE